MLIACIVLVCVLVAFVAITFFITRKNITLQIQEGLLRITNQGSHLKVYLNDNLIQDVFSPPILNGADIMINLGEKEYKLFCKCNTWGTKMKVDLLDGEKVIASNGVEIENKKINKKG